MTAPSRHRKGGVSLRGALLVAVGCLVGCIGTAGCGSDQGSPASTRLSGCSKSITRADDVSAALDEAAPGATLCFTGGDLSAGDFTMTRSGTANAPIRLMSDGSTVSEIHIAADHVIVDGFTVTGGDGMLLEGSWLTARHNTVHDTQRGGITCALCTDSTIEANTVQHVATAGIWVTGQRITVATNTVSGTVPRGQGDADGIRFFGDGHRITGNTIRDISARGYANPPHPDCFQTYDDNNPPTFDVVIAGNSCQNVDAQCLIATGDQHGNSDAPPGVASITFVDNTCATNGDQAVNLRRWPAVVVQHNKISGPNLGRAMLLIDDSTGCTVTDNTTSGNVPAIEVDPSSRPGFHEAANRPS